jgi:hypothetical protein
MYHIFLSLRKRIRPVDWVRATSYSKSAFLLLITSIVKVIATNRSSKMDKLEG